MSHAPPPQASTSFSTAALREVRGKKALIIDPSVSGPLSLVAEFAVLKEHGVDKIFHLTASPLETDCKSLVYITRPNPTHIKWIADQFKRSTSQRSSLHESQPDFTIYFVPRRTLICDKVLEEQDGDPTAIHSVAHAIMKLQILYGAIPRILGRAMVLSELLVFMRRDYSIGDIPTTSTHSKDSEFDSILILDRNVDLISPLRVQLTYEAFVEVSTPVPHASPAAIIPPSYSKPKKLVLNNLDRVFSEIRNLGFEGTTWSYHHHSVERLASKIGGLQQQRQSLSTHNVIYDEILRYAGNLDTVKRWAVEEALTRGEPTSSEHEYIEELIGRQAPIDTVLRLLCLYCIVNGGLKPKHYESLDEALFRLMDMLIY
ncbi:hypothetical protein BSLG_003983 [Batrachochytrium salamandrivorans]|nr:hypothetical protein BSLG_003983 [Batrachochytrium salamandrivorans]